MYILYIKRRKGGEGREGSAASGVNRSMVHAHGTVAPAAPIFGVLP